MNGMDSQIFTLTESHRRMVGESIGDHVLRLMEANDGDGWKWRVRVIKAGMSKNGNNYPPDVLRAAVPLFEGVRALARSDENHVKNSAKHVKDLVGFFTNPAFVNGGIEADFTILESAQWLKTMLKSAWDHGKRDMVGFSIVADAKAVLKRTANGVTRDVKELMKIHSVDAIVDPSAGGEIVTLVAGYDPANDKGLVEIMNIEKLLKLFEAIAPEKFKKLDQKNLPDADELLKMVTEAVEANKGDAEALAKLTEAITGAVEEPAKKKEKDPAAAATIDATAITEAVTAATTTLAESFTKKLNEQSARTAFDAAFTASKLPDGARDRIHTTLAAESKDGTITATVMEAAFKAERDYLAGARPAFTGPQSAFSGVMVEADATDKCVAAIRGLFMEADMPLDMDKPKSAKVPRFHSLREAYTMFTGDNHFTGRADRKTGMVISEALDMTDWTLVLGDSIARRMQMEYNRAPYDQWRAIADVVPVGDFRTQRRGALGGFSDLVSVGEGVDYAAFTTDPSDSEATYDITKFGRLATVTMEMIVNDDVGAVRRIPVKIGRAAARTLNTQVWTPITSNAAIYDGDTLFHANHGGNLGSAALSQGALIAGRTVMMKQVEADSNERLNIGPKYLCVPVDLEETAVELCYSQGKPVLNLSDTNATTGTPTTGTAENAGMPNFIMRNGVVPLVIPHAVDTNNWFMAADKSDMPTMEVGFFQGREEPELFIQDMPNVGSMFTADKITYKVRHVYGKAVLDYRGWYGAVVA